MTPSDIRREAEKITKAIYVFKDHSNGIIVCQNDLVELVIKAVNEAREEDAKIAHKWHMRKDIHFIAKGMAETIEADIERLKLKEPR